MRGNGVAAAHYAVASGSALPGPGSQRHFCCCLFIKCQVADMAAKGMDYEKEKLKKRIDNLKAKGMFEERVPKAKPAAAAAGKKK